VDVDLWAAAASLAGAVTLAEGDSPAVDTAKIRHFFDRPPCNIYRAAFCLKNVFSMVYSLGRIVQEVVKQQ
jgi:hypothetical protein